MKTLKSGRVRWILVFALCAAVLSFGQGKKLKDGIEEERDHPRERDAWFRRGRPSDGGRSAEKLHRAYQQKMAMRTKRVKESQARAAMTSATGTALTGTSQPSAASLPANGAIWVPLGPAPEASDSSGTGSQDYGPVTGRATAVAVDQNDPSGGTVYVGGAYGGVWKSTNASDATVAACGSNPSVRCAPNVTWKPLIDNQATLAVGSIAIKPDDSNVVLVGTGESNSSADSYYGLGILRSTDAGSTWNLVTSAGSQPFRGLSFSRIAFATETFNSLSTNVVVASTAAASGGLTVGGEQTNTTRGLYYSTDAGQTWSYRDSVSDGNGLAPSAGSAHSVIYFPAQHKFYAALRAHGIYSSADGKNWMRLPTQPGSSMTLTNCPTISAQDSLYTCPLYRAELALVPGRNEMYVWMVGVDNAGKEYDQGIYQTRTGGSSWTPVDTSAIAGVGKELDQGTYNLDLAAVPDGSGTDLYAGAVDQWKARLSDPATPGTWGAFVNLTHVYGCDPYGSYSHVHPDEHSIDFLHSNPQIIYFANDGGIYRTLNGFASASGICGTTPYPWDNLNSTMGSMTQYVWFSNHPSDPSTLLGGTQDNGSPATANAGTTQAWISVNNGDGGYNAIDPSGPNTWYTANTYMQWGIQRCLNGVNCKSGDFDANQVITQPMVGGDWGAFYTPYILDPQNPAKIIVGTCRVWRGNADGTNWTGNALSYPNFSASATGCPKASPTNPVDNISVLAAGGPKSAVSNSSQVIWAGTGGYTDQSNSLQGGKVWVTTNADAGPSTWTDRTGAINPKHYPISSIALDPTDPTGQTAYVTIMGFDVSHVWRTSDGGQTWTDYTGDLPNAPADAVVVDPAIPNTVFVGSDVGVFATTNGGVNWTEVGLDANGASTFPNVAVTRLAIFTGGSSEHLRVSTYGRGVWDIDLGVSTSPTFALSVSKPVVTVNAGAGQTTTISGNLQSVHGYSDTVVISCTGAVPATCTPDAASYAVNGITPFNVTVGNPTGSDFSFDIVGTGGDGTTHTYPVTVHVQDFTLSAPSVSAVTIPRGTTSAPVTVEIGSVGQFNGNVNATCTLDVAATGATCSVTPGAGPVSPTAALSESVIVNTVSATPASTYTVTLTATASGLPTKTQTFSAVVQANPDYVLPSPPPDLGSIKATTTASKSFSIGVQDGYAGTVTLTCVLGTPGACDVLPTSVAPPANVTVSVTPSVSASGAATATINITDNSNPPKAHSIALPYTASNYAVQNSGNATTLTGTSATLTFTVASQGNYSGNVNTTCEVNTIPGCATSPTSPSIAAGGTTTVTASIAVPQNATPGAYDVRFTATDAAQSSLTHLAQGSLGVTDFSMAAMPASASIKAGGTAPYQISVTPAGSSPAGVTITYGCSGMPQYSTCAFAPPSQTVGASTVTTQMTISTTAPSSTRTAPAYAFWLPIAGLAAIGIGLRRRRFMLMLLLVAVCALALLQACGGGSSHKVTNPGTPPGTYTVTVSGSVGSAQRTTTVTLTVQ